MRRLILTATVITAIFVGGGTAAKGAWIYFKAQAAQYLIERAWSEHAFSDTPISPWPWADTQVVARLRVPSLRIRQYVLAGAHGQSLAFGPGHLAGTPLPGQAGNSVIAGHRDTHFEFLRFLGPGDDIFFDLPHGQTVRYRVSDVWVTVDTDTRPLAQRSESYLTLITCFPFDALQVGGALRFIVEAQA
ncbi:MAG: class GN sortase [Gammaproteobacteria bacterium]|jgi:sortase A